MSRGFDDEEEDLDDSFNDGVPAAELPTAVPVGEPEVEEEIWDEADFDEEFDEDFDDEPDEDLEQFERELNNPTVESDAEPTDEFDEEDF